MWSAVVLLVLLAAAQITTTKAQETSDKAAPQCKDVRKLLRSTSSIVLDADTLAAVDGGIQRVLNCLPQRAAVQIDLPELKLDETLQIKQPVSIEGSRTSIPCVDGNTQPTIEIRSDGVLLAGFSFVKCNLNNTSGLLQIKGSRNVTLRDMAFESNANTNGPSCLSAIDSTIHMRNTTAKNNTGVHGGVFSMEKSTATVVGCSFEGNHATQQGGAIHMHESDLNLLNSRFTGNLAFDTGGAIFAVGEKGSDVNITDVEFGGNRVYGEYKNDSTHRAGGGLALLGPELNARIVDGMFVNNSAVNLGGAINAFNGTRVFMQGSTFIENRSVQGGAILMKSALPNITTLELEGCSFEKNHAEGGFEGLPPLGGAIEMIGNGTEVTLKDCTFVENKAGELGGAVLVDQSKRMDIFRSNFVGNRVGQMDMHTTTKGASIGSGNESVLAFGGAAHLWGVPNISIVESSFTKNQAESGGGGLSVGAFGNLEVRGTTFERNSVEGSANSYGGAMTLVGNGTSTTLDNVTFSYNTAVVQTGGESAGGGAMSGSDMGSLKISRSTFNRNKVVKRQAVPMQSGPHVKSEVDDGEQKGSFLGGALFLLKIPDISIEDCMFTGNRAAATGGAISILAPGVDASDAKIVGCTFDGNSAAGDSNATTLGGGLYISGGVLRASIKDSNFTKNGANTSGGALYGRKFSSLKISHSLFFENRVVKDDGKSFGDSVNGTRYLGGVDIAVGGAILLTDVSETFIVKSSFARNKAQDGGGIYAATVDRDRALVLMESTEFSNNFARDDGGAAYFSNANASIVDSIFKGNNAEGFGGAIHSHSENFGGSLLKIERTVFSSNEANEGGGAMSAVRTKYLISGSIFWKNTAGYGGAVEGSSVAVDISQCSFKNNTSIDNGGGMYLWTSTLLVESTKFTENVAMHSDGGALGLMSTNATISKSNFTGNVGYGQGGAIHSAHVKWQQAPFLDGFDESSFPEAILPETERNRLADLLVNAMRDKLEVGAFIKTSDVEFKDNHAASNGGAVFSLGLDLEMEGGLCQNNSAGKSGGAIYLIEIPGHVPAATIKSTAFLENQATFGGAVFLQNRDFYLSHCDFRSNIAGSGGGALHCEHSGLRLIQGHRNSAITVHSSEFSGNKAGASHEGKEDISLTSINGRGGAVLMSGLGLVSEFKSCNFSNNVAGSGGAIHMQDVQNLTVQDSDFWMGSALTGGALRIISAGDSFTASNVSFVGNHARWGGAVSLGLTTGTRSDLLLEGAVSLVQVRFLENVATRGGGAIDMKDRTLECTSCRFDFNKAGFGGNDIGSGGAIRALSASNLTLGNTTIIGCMAAQSGGGVSLEDAIFHGENVTIMNNTAIKNGGGLAIHFPANFPWRCRSCSFQGNKARKGGGISISADETLHQDCQALEATSSVKSQHQLFELLADCKQFLDESKSPGPQVLLESTTFDGNIAEDSGSDMFLTGFKNDICCDSECWSVASALEEGLEKCGLGENSRRGGENPAPLGTIFESVSISPSDILNHASGEELPAIRVTPLDSFGQISADNVTLRVEVATPGGELFGSPVTSEGVLMSGGIDVTGMFMRALPGDYNLSFELTSEDGGRIVTEVVSVGIRECVIGEVSREEGLRCDRCPDDFFSFDVADENCTPCPAERAKCSGGRLAPLEGFWHSEPRSARTHACLTEEACTYPNRTEILFASNFEDNSEEYPQCAKGYGDILCGSCAASYGRSRFKCTECQGGVRAGLGIGVVMLALAVLSLIYVKSAAKYSEGVLGKQSDARSPSAAVQSGPRGLNLPAFVLGEIEIAEQHVQRPHQNAHQDAPPRKTRCSDIFKILVNFFQVTGSAAAINVGWNRSMLLMFASWDFISGVADSSNFFSLECAFLSGKNNLPRSVQTSIFLALVPFMVWAALVLIHYGHAWRSKKSFRDIKLWSCVALLAVQQASYIGVTRTLVRIFSCVDASPMEGLFWVQDTSVRCYEGSHAFLVGFVGAPGLLVVSIGFPGWLLFKLTRSKESLEEEVVVRKYGFLYQAYKKNAAAWEVVILLRKALLSAIVVFGRTLGEGVQISLALITMTASVILQMHFQPFLESKLNLMEVGSLAISTLAFIIGNLVNQPEVSDGGTVAMSVIFFGTTGIYVVYMLKQISDLAFLELRDWMRNENSGSALPTSKFRLLMAATKSQAKKTNTTLNKKRITFVKKISSCLFSEMSCR